LRLTHQKLSQMHGFLWRTMVIWRYNNPTVQKSCFTDISICWWLRLSKSFLFCCTFFFPTSR